MGCSTERTAHKPVHDNAATLSVPIKWKGNVNLETDDKGRKKFVRFEEPIVRRSDRIRTANRVEKLDGMECFQSKLDRLEKGPTTPSKVIRNTRQKTLAATNVQSTSATYLGSQNWFP